MSKRITITPDATEEEIFAKVARTTARALNDLDPKARDQAVAALKKGVAQEQSPDSVSLLKAVLDELTRPS